MKITASFMGTFLLLASSAVIADDDVCIEADGVWAVESMFLVGRKNFLGEVREEARGHVLHSTGDKSLGAAFRCDDGKLSTYVVVKPINIHDMILWRSPRPRRWPVEFSLNGSDSKSEEWVSIHGATVYLVIDPITALRIFDFAEYGLSIDVDAKGAKPVSIELPPDEDGKFEQFRRHCGLKREHESL